MTHNRRHRHLPTGLTATDGDVRGSELVSALLIDKTNEIMKEMRDRCNALGASLLTTDIDTLARLATWAANDCGVDIYVVEKALCHKPAGLGVTETYIKPDYRRTDNANRLVLDMLAEGDL